MTINLRSIVAICLVGLTISLGTHALWPAANAAIPESTYATIYQPDFEEWVFLYLNAVYRDSSGGTHFVAVSRQNVNGRLQFKITGSYSKTPLGRAWYDKFGSKIRQSVEADCKYWSGYGLKIGLNDIDVDITPAPDKPQ